MTPLGVLQQTELRVASSTVAQELNTHISLCGGETKDLLAHLELQQHLDALLSARIDTAALLLMSEYDLAPLLPPLHARKILAAVKCKGGWRHINGFTRTASSTSRISRNSNKFSRSSSIVKSEMLRDWGEWEAKERAEVEREDKANEEMEREERKKKDSNQRQSVGGGATELWATLEDVLREVKTEMQEVRVEASRTAFFWE